MIKIVLSTVGFGNGLKKRKTSELVVEATPTLLPPQILTGNAKLMVAKMQKMVNQERVKPKKRIKFAA